MSEPAAGPWVQYHEGCAVPEGEYLCFVKVPKRAHGGRVKPAHYRYMHLEFAEGGFWVNGGQPKGWVLFYAAINPPTL